MEVRQLVRNGTGMANDCPHLPDRGAIKLAWNPNRFPTELAGVIANFYAGEIPREIREVVSEARPGREREREKERRHNAAN
jgi:hypothetical protein